MLKKDHKGTNQQGNTGVKVHRVRGQRVVGHCPVMELLLPLMALSIFTS